MRHSVGIRLLFANLRSQQIVDATLESRPPIVALIDGSSQFHEARAEIHMGSATIGYIAHAGGTGSFYTENDVGSDTSSGGSTTSHDTLTANDAGSVINDYYSTTRNKRGRESLIAVIQTS